MSYLYFLQTCAIEWFPERIRYGEYESCGEDVGRGHEVHTDSTKSVNGCQKRLEEWPQYIAVWDQRTDQAEQQTAIKPINETTNERNKLQDQVPSPGEVCRILNYINNRSGHTHSSAFAQVVE